MKLIRHLKTFRLKYLRPLWQSHHWLIIGTAAILTILCGYIGFYRHFLSIGETRSFLDILYLTLQLFTFESGAVPSPLPWELELARLLAPAVAAYAALKALSLVFREQLQLFRVSFIRDHVVICGLGRKGVLLAKCFREQGYAVVVIDSDEGNDYIIQCRDEGAVVFIGDATDSRLLKKARVHRAKYCISVCGDDGINAEISVHALNLVKKRRKKVLTCIVHVVDPQLCSLLREKEIESGKPDAFRLDFFNVFDRGARAWLDEHPPFKKDRKSGDPLPHLLIVGAGRMGESLIVHATKEWEPFFTSSGKKLRITLIDKFAEKKKEMLCLNDSQIEKICDIYPLQIDVLSPDFLRAKFLFDARKRCHITNVYVCLDDDSFGLSTGLILYQHLRGKGIPIIVRVRTEAGLATLFKREEKGSFSHFFTFSLLDKTCRPEHVLGSPMIF
jgi:hypothetical protein